MSKVKLASYRKSVQATTARLNDLKIKSEAITASLQDAPLTQVQNRKLAGYLSECGKRRDDYESLFRKVIDLDDEEFKLEDILKDQSSILDLAVEVTSIIESILPGQTPLSPVTIHDASLPVAQPMAQISLPKLSLKTFSGNPQEWATYINMFDTSVHHAANLPAVTKMNYLVSTLSADALALVKGLPITSANYMVAYNLLRKRYHNPRRLMMVHLNSLIDLPQISHSSPKGWRKFINLYNEHSQALSSLDCSLAGDNPFLSAYLMSKFNPELSKKLEAYRLQQQCDHHTLPTAEQIIEYLNFECNLAEDASYHASRSPPPSYTERSLPSKLASHSRRDTWEPRPTKHVTLHSQREPHVTKPSVAIKCFACQDPDHKIYNCPTFEALSPRERGQLVRRCWRCTSCLGNHDFTKCSSLSKCRVCQNRHHTLLHDDTYATQLQRVGHSTAPQRITSPNTSQQTTQPSKPTAHPSHHVAMTSLEYACDAMTYSTVLLGTTLVLLHSENGHSQVFRGLIDSGSTSSFISSTAAQLLQAPRYHSQLQVAGISGNSSRTKGLLRLSVSTLCGDLIAAPHDLYILDKISVPLPTATIAPEVVHMAQAYLLADPSFHLPGPVDVLLGADIFSQLLTQDLHPLGPHLPTMLGTRFGYVVIGQAPTYVPCGPSTTSHHSIALLSVEEIDLHNSLQKFWTLEEPPKASLTSAEDVLCEEHFKSTHSRTTEGRYCVSLPFKAFHPPLGTSRTQAEKRFLSLERKLQGQPQLHESYRNFMCDYELRGHMTKCDPHDLDSASYYLPHHGVMKTSGDTSKIRVVFDASAKTSTGISLNDTLMTGPKLQADICDLILNFRSHNVVFTCDVEQMYRQILVTSEDHRFQHILWRNSPSQPLATYKLNTVTYGVSSAPYLAIRTLHQLAEDEGADFPAAAKILKEQTFVDDILAGCDTVEDAHQLQQELISLLKRGGFTLKKWTSNKRELLCSLPTEHLDTPAFLDKPSHSLHSVLGLRWSPDSDHFSYELNLPIEATSKRQILSLIAQIYDPCGFLAPVTMKCKIFMQFLWTLGIDWDASLPEDHLHTWRSIHKELALLSKIRIPRHVSFSHACAVELHGFADASEAGYAAVIYVRCVYSDGTLTVWPLLAKTRVAPLKRVTLPRLELCGVHLLAQLIRYVISTLSHIKFTDHRLWCDSKIVLAWLRTPPYRLKTFVANRVAQIQEWIPSQYFHHVSGIVNPADCASRGIFPSQLRSHVLWWTGPPWLLQDSTTWPFDDDPQDLTPGVEELKKDPLLALTSTQLDEWDLLSRFSSWERLQRVMAYVLRFVNHSRRRKTQPHTSPLLTVSELRSASHRVVFLVQQHSFFEDIALLQRQKPPSQRLRRLSPFLDADGLLRVGGRLRNAPLPLHSRHPLLLPKEHSVVDLIIDSHHVSMLHAGPQLTQAVLARRYWILAARSKIRSRIFKCVTCFRHRPHFISPLMADLPAARVTPSKPFSSTGVDYAGPFNTKVIHLRGARQIKVYLCIFICLSTKAVHLEVVTDLTTEAFIAALSRFISRRGRCSDIYSDCGTNFVGAAAELRKIINSIKSQTSREQVTNFTASMEVNFHFNPPSAPHFGGLWESAVKSAKHHLRRVIGELVLTLPEFITLVTRVEAILNSRPLTQLSSDPRDLSVLTPGHFLIGEPMVSLPEENWNDTHLSRLRHYQLSQALLQRLWHRWQQEYLHTLQNRPKWHSPRENLKVGDLVLIHQTSPPLTWPRGRITALYPGSDGIPRVAEVETATSSFRRPVVKLARLPVDV